MPLQKARFRISDYNAQRKASIKDKERRIRNVSLSLTSMVDMFAILVIFLLTSSSTVNSWMEVGHKIELPKAHTSDAPPKAINIQISPESIFADDKALVNLNGITRGTDAAIPALKNWLLGQKKKDGYINVVGDRRVPFGVIKRVISTCQESGYGNVNLAVQPKGGLGG